MSGPSDLSPAELRVRELLGQLRGAPPAAPPGTDLARRVVRTARWQRALRSALAATGNVFGALGDGLAVLARRGR
jgi:hypothetical protein